jgi:hypothetical protein
MTTKTAPDRRIQRTRQLLLDSLIALILEHDYDTITVQDIIDRANVGRSTFYSHFPDKEALLVSGAEALLTVFDGFHSQPSPEQTSWDFSLALFRHIEEKRRVFKALLGNQAGNIVLKHFRKMLNLLLKEHFQMMYPKKKQPVPLEVLVQYFVNTFLGLLTWWLDTDNTCTAEQLNGYYRKLTEPTMYSLLRGA